MATARGASTGPGWLATLAGATILVVAGFGVGLVAGTAFEEPDLVMEHLSGNTTEVDLALQDERRAFAEPAARSEDAEAEAPAPVAAPPPASPPADGGYAIQVGAFSSETAAQELASELRQLGIPSYIEAEPDRSRYKVRVGPIATEAEAKRTARRLKTEHRLPTWVLSRES